MSPPLSYHEHLRVMGGKAVRQSGSHVTLKHASKRGYVTVPSHMGVTIKPKTLAAILKQAGLTADELRQLM